MQQIFWSSVSDVKTCKNQLEDRGEDREQEPSRKGGGKGAG